jgi:hypothetical protein
MVTHTTCTCTCTATCTCACGDMPMRTDRRVSHVRAQRVSPAERESRGLAPGGVLRFARMCTSIYNSRENHGHNHGHELHWSPRPAAAPLHEDLRLNSPTTTRLLIGPQSTTMHGPSDDARPQSTTMHGFASTAGAAALPAAPEADVPPPAGSPPAADAPPAVDLPPEDLRGGLVCASWPVSLQGSLTALCAR